MTVYKYRQLFTGESMYGRMCCMHITMIVQCAACCLLSVVLYVVSYTRQSSLLISKAIQSSYRISHLRSCCFLSVLSHDKCYWHATVVLTHLCTRCAHAGIRKCIPTHQFLVTLAGFYPVGGGGGGARVSTSKFQNL